MTQPALETGFHKTEMNKRKKVHVKCYPEGSSNRP